jgi:uncharacterized protein (TIGR02444 family)
MRQQKHGESIVSGEAFWRFSRALYARSGVAEALIALQDRAGLDVNLMLFALWRGAVYGHRLSGAALRAAEAAIAPLREDVILPLRALRRRLKPAQDDNVQALRRRIGRLELAAERAAQARLAETVIGSVESDDRRAAAAANLAVYLGGEAQSAEAAVLRQALGDFLARG